MSFIHENAVEFADLVQIIVGETGMGRSIIRKDYWVTHVLWALSVSGLDVWFRGGTSLSKGFGLIKRFSEDLDLKIEPGSVATLPKVSSWKSEGTKATAERRTFFEQLPKVLAIPGCTIELEQETLDKSWRGANLRVLYPGVIPWRAAVGHLRQRAPRGRQCSRHAPRRAGPDIVDSREARHHQPARRVP